MFNIPINKLFLEYSRNVLAAVCDRALDEFYSIDILFSIEVSFGETQILAFLPITYIEILSFSHQLLQEVWAYDRVSNNISLCLIVT